MARVTFLGGEAVGNIGSMTWPIGPAGNKRDLVFPLNKAVEVTDPHVLKKIRGMKDSGIFQIEGDEEKAPTGHGASADAGDNDEEESAGTLKHGGTRARKIP